MPQAKFSRALYTLVLGVLLFLGVAACTWQELRPGAEHNRRLYVIGTLQHVNPEQVANAARAHLGKGFFEVEVAAIQEAVGALPWVGGVSVHRRWPDAVVVRVQEHHPVARWGKQALISDQEIVFTPPEGSVSDDMVHLDGPQGSGATVLKMFPELQTIAKRGNREIAALSLDARGSWQATLKDGLELRLGRVNPEQRLHGFVTQLLNHTGPALSKRLETAGYVDLRYTDGFAVGGTRAEQPDQAKAGPGAGLGQKQGEQYDQKA